MGKDNAIDRVGDGHRDYRQFRRDDFRNGPFLHDRDTQRHVNLAGTAGWPCDDAAFNADLHGHDTGIDVTLARGADDRSLITQIEHARGATGRLAMYR